MTVLTRFYPYRELNTLQDRVNRLFHESFTNPKAATSLWPRQALLRRLTSTKMSTTSP